MHSADAMFDVRSASQTREIQSFRGIIIGIALSTMFWAPIGVVALRLL